MDDENFKVIEPESTRASLWEDLADAKGEIICKGKSEDVCILEIMTFNYEELKMECDFKSQTKMEENEEYLASFVYKSEKYYFYGKTDIKFNRIIIPLPSIIYQLHRRQNYRIKLPTTFKGFFNVIQVNDKSLFKPGSLIDVSGMGCRISTECGNFSLEKNDKIVGVLVIEKRSPIELSGIIRHSFLTEEKEKKQICGIEFESIPTLIESKLFAIMMDLHKQFYKKIV